MAVVDANANFLYIDVGANGRISDGGVWERCSLKSAIENATLNLPATDLLSGTREEVPYVFLADEAFPLTDYLLKPFPSRLLTSQRRRFNYRLSRARQVVERAFGLLAQRFRIFRGTIALEPDKCDLVVKAACVLHNWLNASGHTTIQQSDALDVPFDPLSSHYRASRQSAREVRNAFCDYFSAT